MTERVRAIRCPSCGAPIGMPEGNRRLFTCEFCGSTLEDQTTPKERETGIYPKVVIREAPRVAAQPVLTPEISISPGIARRTRRRARILILAITIPLCIGVGIALYASGWLGLNGQDMASRLSAQRISSYGLVRLVPADDDSQPDLIAVGRYPEAIIKMVYLDFDSDPPLRWVSKPLGDGAAYLYNASAQNQTQIFMAYETTLTAFNRGDGAITWLAELSDEVSNICRDCLQVFGNRLVALTADGRLSGFDTQTGENVWKVRLVSTPRQLVDLAGQVVVLDEDEDGVGINTYLPKTGEMLKRIVPNCPNDIFPDLPQGISIYDPIFTSADRTKMYVPIHLYDPGCIQVWDGTSLTQIGETPIPRDILVGLNWDSYLLMDETLYIGYEHNLYTIDIADGHYELTYSNPDYNFTPVDAQADTLILRSERTRGTMQYALMGIHPDSGVEPWTFELGEGEFYEFGFSTVSDKGVWVTHTFADKIAIVKAFSDPSYATLTVLNLLDGATTSSSSVQFFDGDSSYWFQAPGWVDDRIVVVTNDQIRWIETSTGNQLVVWP